MLRWAQVTEELRQALWELDEEKEKRRHVEEEMNLNAHEQDNLKNKLSALMNTRENAVMLTGEEAAEPSPPAPATSPSEEEDKLVGELKNEQEKEAGFPSHQKQQELLLLSPQEIKQPAISAKQSPELRDDNQLQTLQVHQYDKWVCVNSLIGL